MSHPFKEINFGPRETKKSAGENGTILLESLEKLNEFPEKITERLIQWAKKTPDKTFIARRDEKGEWIRLSYSQTLEKVKSIAQYLLNLNFGKDDTIVILSENSLEHALLSLAAVHIGVTYTPVSPPYSLVSSDFGKLKHSLNIMTPKLVFAQDGKVYEKALQLSKELFPQAVIVNVSNGSEMLFSEILNIKPTVQVEEAFEKVTADTIAKVLFTSGSTGLPKGVINSQRMWCANLQQISQAFPFMQSEPPVFIDWLPWNHTFGGNHNFGLALYNGGTLYIDDGKPTPKGIWITVKNLKEISPTAYFNVPVGFEMLIPHFEKDEELRKTFFKNLQILFYAGASLAQPIWNKWEELAVETLGERIPFITGLGCTESGPSAMFANWHGSFSGLLGIPVAGLKVKMVPNDDKFEARYLAPNVTPGYWRNEEETKKAFDEEGYYKTGDAVKFLDETNPDKGLVFDGRIAEDFKLSTGTWVNVGILKAKVIANGSPIVQDVVIAGLDKAYIGAILFLNQMACRKLAHLPESATAQECYSHPKVKSFLDDLQLKLNALATGSATKIEKMIVAIDPPSIDLGEITDKGSLNQRAILKHRTALVEELYKTKANVSI